MILDKRTEIKQDVPTTIYTYSINKYPPYGAQGVNVPYAAIRVLIQDTTNAANVIVFTISMLIVNDHVDWSMVDRLGNTCFFRSRLGIDVEYDMEKHEVKVVVITDKTPVIVKAEVLSRI